VNHEQIQILSLDKIKANNLVRDGKYDEQELIGLAITIREVGQLVPIRVQQDGEFYAILDGHRRFEAMRRLKRPDIAAIVDQPLDEGQSLHRQWVANCQRVEVPAIDRARAIKRLIAVTGWSHSEAARQLGKTPAAISRALAIDDLPEPIVASVEQGHLAPSTAVELAKIIDPQKQAELATRAASGQLTRDEVAAEVASQKKGRKKRRRKAEANVEIVVAGGDRITVTGRELSLASVKQCLEEALDQVRQVQANGGDVDQLKRRCREKMKASQAA
jgi:ParB/RepB/Spo0J family partition protein